MLRKDHRHDAVGFFRHALSKIELLWRQSQLFGSVYLSLGLISRSEQQDGNVSLAAKRKYAVEVLLHRGLGSKARRLYGLHAVCRKRLFQILRQRALPFSVQEGVNHSHTHLRKQGKQRILIFQEHRRFQCCLQGELRLLFLGYGHGLSLSLTGEQEFQSAIDSRIDGLIRDGLALFDGILELEDRHVAAFLDLLFHLSVLCQCRAQGIG